MITFKQYITEASWDDIRYQSDTNVEGLKRITKHPKNNEKEARFVIQHKTGRLDASAGYDYTHSDLAGGSRIHSAGYVHYHPKIKTFSYRLETGTVQTNDKPHPLINTFKDHGIVDEDTIRDADKYNPDTDSPAAIKKGMAGKLLASKTESTLTGLGFKKTSLPSNPRYADQDEYTGDHDAFNDTELHKTLVGHGWEDHGVTRRGLYGDSPASSRDFQHPDHYGHELSITRDNKITHMKEML